MTRNDGLASSRPQMADAGPIRRRSVRALGSLILSVSAALALLVALAMPTPALSTETSGYGQTPSTPTTPATTTPAATTPTPTTPAATTPAATTPAPTTGTLPSKESSKPKSKTEPATSKPATKTTPTTTTPATKATTLPFTGLDLRWTIGIGLLLMGAGFLIVTEQRRDRRDSGRR